MVRMDGAEVRKERLATFAKYIHARLHEHPEGIPLRKTICELSLGGPTPSRVKEYLELLNEAGQFEIDEKNDKIIRTRV